MPLTTSPSAGAFIHNLKAELAAGKKTKQALAIAYAKKREAGGSDQGETPYTGGTVTPSVRHIDADGRMHVKVCHISKANVCPYKGSEIPEYKSLGLDGNKVYMLYRSPEELERAAATFNNIQIMMGHIPVTADDHQPDRVVGTTGSECVFNPPFLDNSIAVWTDEAIAGVESAEIKELSSAYRYRADMAAGVTPDGVAYDGIMRDIVGNHVALVPAGRAGPDVVVGDEKADWMSKRIDVLRSTLAPVMAQDKSLDLTALLMALDKAKDEMEEEDAGAEDKKARDRRAKDRKAAMDAMRAKGGEEEETAEEREEREASDRAEDARRARDGEEEESEKEREERYSEDRKHARDRMKGRDAKRARDRLGRDETEEERMEREKADDERRAKDKGLIRVRTRTGRSHDEPPKFEGKPRDPAEDKRAMDAAITSAVSQATANFNAIRDAERAVRPYVGEIVVAMDSADEVYRFALDQLGVKTAGIHPSAWPTLLALAGKTNTSAPPPRFAMDSAAATDLFPNARRIGQA